MPYQSGKLKGELTAAEIRKLIRAHNKLSQIKIPPKTDRDGLIKLITDRGLRIDHKNAKLVGKVKDVDVTLSKAEEMKKKQAEENKKKKPAREAKKKERDIKKKAEEGELIKKGAVIGKLLAKKQMNQKKKVPKGSHRMPDGTIMKDSDMPKKKAIPKAPKAPSTKKSKGYQKDVVQSHNPKIQQQHQEFCQDLIRYSELYMEGVKKNWTKKSLNNQDIEEAEIRFKINLAFQYFEKNYQKAINICGVQEANVYKKAYELYKQQGGGKYIKKKEAAKKAPKKAAAKKELKGFDILKLFVNRNMKRRIKIINDHLSGKITEDKREELENDISDVVSADMKKKVSSELLEPNGTIKSKYFEQMKDPSLVKELKSILNKEPAKKKESKKAAAKKEESESEQGVQNKIQKLILTYTRVINEELTEAEEEKKDYPEGGHGMSIDKYKKDVQRILGKANEGIWKILRTEWKGASKYSGRYKRSDTEEYYYGLLKFPRDASVGLKKKIFRARRKLVSGEYRPDLKFTFKESELPKLPFNEPSEEEKKKDTQLAIKKHEALEEYAEKHGINNLNKIPKAEKDKIYKAAGITLIA